MIAMALACNPTVLIADEPTTALDVSIQAQILDLLDDLRLQRSLGVLLITHDLNVVRRRADVVCVMYRGKVVEYGRGPDLLANPIHPYTAALLTCAPGLTTRGTTLPTVATSKHPHFNATLPPLGSHITPWWPGSGSSSLIKVGADHWVCACGATPADIDPIRPDIAWCRD
jgi:ABC-type dipeptide/oligopeptide/nickel transport system ATPase component